MAIFYVILYQIHNLCWMDSTLPTCECLRYIFTGTGTNYHYSTGTVTNGNYDEASGTLTVTDGEGNPEGQVNLANKSFRGKLKGNGDAQFTVFYQG